MTEGQIMFSVISIVVSAIVAALLTYYFGIRTSDRNRRLDAGARLYYAFAQEIRHLERGLDATTDGMTDMQIANLPETELKRLLYPGSILTATVIDSQITAACEFRYFLSPGEREGFDIAWKEYRNESHEYADYNKTSKELALIRRRALERIHNILRFTEQ